MSERERPKPDDMCWPVLVTDRRDRSFIVFIPASDRAGAIRNAVDRAPEHARDEFKYQSRDDWEPRLYRDLPVLTAEQLTQACNEAWGED